MARDGSGVRLAAVGGVAVVAAATVVVGILVYVGRDRGASDPPPDQAGMPFREGAVAAGIGFHMDFLPSEQGVMPFKINLYDHGSGLAVGDFDADGFGDVYF